MSANLFRKFAQIAICKFHSEFSRANLFGCKLQIAYIIPVMMYLSGSIGSKAKRNLRLASHAFARTLAVNDSKLSTLFNTQTSLQGSNNDCGQSSEYVLAYHPIFIVVASNRRADRGASERPAKA